MKGSVLLGTFAASIILVSSEMAYADVLYSFWGTVDTIEYNDVATDTPLPFALGDGVGAELDVPGFFGGIFTVESSALFINGSHALPSAVNGSVFFQSGGAIRFDPRFIRLAAVGFYPSNNGTLIKYIDLCCNFAPLFFLPFESGQTRFYGDSFIAAYLPTGQSAVNVTVTGAGEWSAQLIPEPGSLALMGIAFAALGLVPRAFTGRK